MINIQWLATFPDGKLPTNQKKKKKRKKRRRKKKKHSL